MCTRASSHRSIDTNELESSLDSATCDLLSNQDIQWAHCSTRATEVCSDDERRHCLSDEIRSREFQSIKELFELIVEMLFTADWTDENRSISSVTLPMFYTMDLLCFLGSFWRFTSPWYQQRSTDTGSRDLARVRTLACLISSHCPIIRVTCRISELCYNGYVMNWIAWSNSFRTWSIKAI